MYLSKLELHGFKSFAERTVLHFDPGITAIVGPNGCGKSNIVDAVRWVIGEQRARILRSEKMENVIFNGTSRRRALGMSEVLLTVQNTRNVLPTEYGEVTLGRRLYRSGDSEYLLNDVQCRLKDITDLFMDTGMGAGAYSVIELKMVDEILSENAQDRRRLFEEAAGITRYKLRRKQTLSKLGTTKIDLDRVRDLTEEVGKQVRSLKRQAEKAGRYRDYSERLRVLELTLAQLEFDRLSARDAELNRAISELKQTIDTLAADERALDARLAERKAALEDAEASLDLARKALSDHQEAMRKLETEQRLTLERLDGAYRDIERMRREEAADAQRLEALEKESETTAQALQNSAPACEAAEARLEELRVARDAAREELAQKRTAVEELRRRERILDDRRTAEQRKIDRQLNRREFLEAERARLEHEHEALASQRGELERRARDAADRFEVAARDRDAVQARLATASEERESAEQALHRIAERVRELEKRREGVSAEAQLLESLVASFDEFPDAVQYLASDASWSDVPLRTVADVLSCPPEYRTALDAALGPLASCIIVGREAELQRASARLNAENRGRATFIVMERLPNDVKADAPGDAALLNHVRVDDSRYVPLARMMLRSVLFAFTLEEAMKRSASHPGTRVVTADGEWVVDGAIVHTGSGNVAPSAIAGRMERREQLESTRTQLAEIDREIESMRGQQARAAETVEAVPVESIRTELRLAEHTLSEIEKDEARASYDLETMQRRLAEQDQRLASLAAEMEAIVATLEKESAALEALVEEHVQVSRARSDAEAAFAEAEERAVEAGTSFNEANVAAIQERNRVENLQREAERIASAHRAIETRRAERRAHQQSLTDQVSAWQSELDTLRTAAEERETEREPHEKAVVEATQRVSQVRSDITGIEQDLKQVRQQREERIRLENQHAVNRAEVETRLGDLISSVREDFDVSLGEDVVEMEDVEEAEARQEVVDLRQRVRSLGAVNELALESYEEERERLEFLEAQQRDLESAEQTLLETIHELNTTASARFRDTYTAIQESFSRIFRDLFGEDASAELVLEDPSDPLESAIEIKAKPRGKRPSTIAQLSGGEKTLTAIALLFAIYLVKPSPFCILDEVDAPLDDANVERFMALIRSFSADTQFILVTHNKRTMEAADRLYGITMQEQGVSKLVGVRFEEAAEMVG